MQEDWQGWCGQAQRRSYRTGRSALTVIGGILTAAGLLLLFLCIPGWLWTALAGAAMIAVGAWLMMLGRR